MYTREGSRILRDGEHVATLTDGKVKYEKGCSKYRLPIAKLLKAPAAPKAKAVNTWDMPVHKAFPDAPGKHSPMGDKDSDLVRWIYENHREDFDNRYKGRKTCIGHNQRKNEESPTRKAVRAQALGFADKRNRVGSNPESHGFTGVFAREYEVGFNNG